MDRYAVRSQNVQGPQKSADYSGTPLLTVGTLRCRIR